MKGFLAFLGGVTLGVGGVLLYPKAKAAWKAQFGQAALPDTIKNAVGVHIRQIRRYAFASSQDLSPIVGITHASYALILLETLEEIIGREAIAKAGVNPASLREFITKLQDKHAEALKSCDSHLQQILQIERAEGMQLPGFVVAGAPTGA